MADLTVNPKIKIEVSRQDIVISNEQALLILCRHCGNYKNVSLHGDPTADEMKHGGMLQTGTVQYPTFAACHCNAPNPGGGQYDLRSVKEAVKTCKTVEEIVRMLDTWIVYAEMERKR